jgi:hypothetical protein
MLALFLVLPFLPIPPVVPGPGREAAQALLVSTPVPTLSPSFDYGSATGFMITGGGSQRNLWLYLGQNGTISLVVQSLMNETSTVSITASAVDVIAPGDIVPVANVTASVANATVVLPALGSIEDAVHVTVSQDAPLGNFWLTCGAVGSTQANVEYDTGTYFGVLSPGSQVPVPEFPGGTPLSVVMLGVAAALVLERRFRIVPSPKPL